MPEILVGTDNRERYVVPVLLWAPQAEVEQEAKTQLYNVAKLPWAFHHVAVMPDVHYGKGATVGSVIAMRGAVSPSAVGVDIGCGMGALRTNLRASDLPDGLKGLRLDVEDRIPVGFNQHDEPVLKKSQRQLFDRFKDLHPGVQDLEGKALRQVGTLGGGNHFIELSLDEWERVWVVLHSGSRNIGKCLAEIHVRAAQKLAHNRDLPDRDLSVFLAGTPEYDAYLRDLTWAQEYALLNRRTMFCLLQEVLEDHFPRVRVEESVLCHHNYVSVEEHFGERVVVTRKGAIRAGFGERGVIPGSMGSKSYVVAGLGNPDSFCSASHGAGRRMSRGRAKRQYSLDDLVEQTRGVECRKDEGVVDEIPGAYKDVEQVMRNQADLVCVLAELKQVLCVKG